MDGPHVDVVQYPSGAVKAVPAGKGAAIARSQRRRRPASLLRDRVVLAAAGVGLVGAGALSVLVLAYSLLIARALLLGLIGVVLLVGGAGGIVAAVAGVRWLQLGDGTLLAEDVSLRDAREQWSAEPVSAVVEDGGASPDADRGHAREHASEGSAG